MPTIGERVSTLEALLRDHLSRCENRAARAEKWMRAAVMGVGLLLLETVLRFWVDIPLHLK